MFAAITMATNYCFSCLPTFGLVASARQHQPLARVFMSPGVAEGNNQAVLRGMYCPEAAATWARWRTGSSTSP